MIDKIGSVDLTVGSKLSSHAVKGVEGEGGSFQEMLTEAVNKIGALDREATSMQTAFARGENVELHEVVIAMEKASIALELAMAVRNKVVEAYQEIMRMNV
jgi:flagellar hook-basal body complex protein FliE